LLESHTNNWQIIAPSYSNYTSSKSQWYGHFCHTTGLKKCVLIISQNKNRWTGNGKADPHKVNAVHAEQALAKCKV
jgi:hypothetical protein